MGVRRRIGDVQLFAELAQGPTTVVYKGYERRLERFVLLKMLRRVVSHDAELARRFEEEARLVAQIQHPNVVSIYAYGREDDQPYIAAEFVEGVDLRGLLARGPLPVELATFILLEAARGLQAAHVRGILHRDLKPSNILVSHGGHVKLTDFGMASLVGDDAAPEVRGTPGYLAPEQVRGAPPAGTSDLFSLGATWFEMLAGRPPFTGSRTGDLLDAVLHDDPMPRLERFAEVPPEARRICARLLAKDPGERYPDAGALIADLEAFRAGGLAASASDLQAYQEDPEAYRRAARGNALRVEPSKPAAGERPPVPVEKPASRSRARYALGLAFAVLVVGVVAGGMLLRRQGPDEAATAVPEEIDESRAADAEPGPIPRPAQEDGEAAPEAGMQEVLAYQPQEEKPEGQVPVRPDVQDPSMRFAAAPDSAAAGRGEAEAAGTLAVNAGPWADVYVDGEYAGRTPLSTPLPAGTHRVELRNASFPAYSTDVEVGAGEERQVNVSLWNLVGRLWIVASPWAEVIVDGVVRDTTPVMDRPLILLPGTRELVLRNPALGAWKTVRIVRPGAADTLRFNLHELLGK